MNSKSLLEQHSFWRQAIFILKVCLLSWRRSVEDYFLKPVQRYPKATSLEAATVLAESRSSLWNAADTPDNWLLTAGKVHNLRIAAQALHGVEIPPTRIFSFWAHVPKPTKAQGYVDGREIREGCLVPSTAGGLCQLSNALFDAASRAGLKIVERHRHTQVVPGSLAEQGRDATVKWRHIDLRLAHTQAWRIEVELSTTELILRIRAPSAVPSSHASAAVLPMKRLSTKEAASAINDCYSCGQSRCAQHPTPRLPTLAKHATQAWLLTEMWPEFDELLIKQVQTKDSFFLPWTWQWPARPAYRWKNIPLTAKPYGAEFITLRRSLALRNLPKQGSTLQMALLKWDAALATTYARHLPVHCTHLIISQPLLPHLWKLGVLGGRTFDVLITRSPLQFLQKNLDEALKNHPTSPTLGDYRAPADLVQAEQSALAAAQGLYTPHTALFDTLGRAAKLLPWYKPAVNPAVSKGKVLLFPASALARKGVYELAQALQGIDCTVRVLGRAQETKHTWGSVKIEACPPGDPLEKVGLVVLPAWVEHQPRLLLRALAQSIPVIATPACGLPPQAGLTLIQQGQIDSLRQAIVQGLP
ncbi:MAG: VanW family protein [Burkholderiaceae bacterium]|nr:VanW family protein [Burkholderiaceae bacterium]